MRIGVLTFHRCINYGSYWQARCLVEGLRARGHDAVLLDHQDAGVTRAELRCAFQPLLPVRTRRSDHPDYGRKTRRFIAAVDALPLSPPFELNRPEDAGHYDAVVVGSDEVWNFRHPWYAGRSIFFGTGLATERLVSYAASFGNHDASDGITPEWAERLERFGAISVRDDNALQLVREALGREATLVLDPCLQFPDVIPAAPAPGEEVIVYGHNFPEWFAHAIRRWADDAEQRLVSIGYACDWADESRIDLGPIEFAAAMGGARAVVTNFFHGTVFALRYGKPFVCASTPYRRNKLRDLMRKVGTDERLLDEATGDAAYRDLLDRAPGAQVDATIAALRTRSDAFLDRALG